jgi:hypothetical protein
MQGFRPRAQARGAGHWALSAAAARSAFGRRRNGI